MPFLLHIKGAMPACSPCMVPNKIKIHVVYNSPYRSCTSTNENLNGASDSTKHGSWGTGGGRLQPVLMRPTPQLSVKTRGGGGGGRG